MSLETQLTFNFDTEKPSSFKQEDFICHQGNKAAYDYVMDTSIWLTPVTILCGGDFTGKTYLLNLWATKNHAYRVTPLWLQTQDIMLEAIFQENHTFFALDDLELSLSSKTLEQNLFHLYNHCTNTNKKMLVTTRTPPSIVKFILPDLASRLRASSFLTIEEPSDTEREIFILKYFSDFQLTPELGIVRYIHTHGPRSLHKMHDFFVALQRQIAMRKKRVTKSFIKEVLQLFETYP